MTDPIPKGRQLQQGFFVDKTWNINLEKMWQEFIANKPSINIQDLNNMFNEVRSKKGLSLMFMRENGKSFVINHTSDDKLESNSICVESYNFADIFRRFKYDNKITESAVYLWTFIQT